MKIRLPMQIKTISYSVFINLLIAGMSAISLLIIPKVMDVESFGYYQLYLFYIAYAGMLNFGWCEGIYLRYGGKYYQDLNREQFASQYRYFSAFEVIVYFLTFLAGSFIVRNGDKRTVLSCICICGIITCCRLFLTTVLQATGRIKEYLLTGIFERCTFIGFIVVLIICGYRQYDLFVYSAVISVFASFLLSLYYCREIVFSKRVRLKNIFPEIKENIRAGMKLMLASLTGMLVLGVVRLGIEGHWDISTFGKVSLTLNIANFLSIAINAISMVIYPMLCRAEHDKLPDIYKIGRVLIVSIICAGFIFYYPVYRVLLLWLPNYGESIRYAAILLPICLYESKVSVLIKTYFNTCRLEDLFMKCNIAALALSAALTVISVYVLNNIIFAIFSILIVLIFRCILTELVLARHLSIHVKTDIVIELVMTIAFIVCNWFFGFGGMLAYILLYLCYLAIKRSELKEAIGFVRRMR